MSGQNPEDFMGPRHPQSNYRRGGSSLDYDLGEYRPPPIGGPSIQPHENGMVVHEKTIDTLLTFVKGVILCGGEGWCGNRW